MYNGEGKRVDGFTFSKAHSDIVKTPKHFRISKRDYLVFQLADGSLKILHRSGGTRIKVNRTIDLPDNRVLV